jgi:hypothetical protein
MKLANVPTRPVLGTRSCDSVLESKIKLAPLGFARRTGGTETTPALHGGIGRFKRTAQPARAVSGCRLASTTSVLNARLESRKVGLYSFVRAFC